MVDQARHLRWTLLSALLVSWLTGWAPPAFSQTPVGTPIRNVAQATYNDAGGYRYTVYSDTATVVVSGGYYLVVHKTLEQVMAMPGDTVIYQITVTNTGNQTASAVTLVDTLAAQLVYQSSAPPAQIVGKVLNWAIAAVEPGQTADLTITCTVAPATAFNTNIGNRTWAKIADRSFVSNWVYFTVGQQAALQLTKTVDKPLTFAGDTLTYSLTLRNTGNLLSTQTMLYDDIPDNSLYISSSDNGTLNSGIVSWSIGDLAPQATVSRIVKVLTPSFLPPGTLVTNVANATNAQGISKSATATTQISPEAGKPQLWLTNTTLSGVIPGDTLLFRLVYGNTGQVKATGVTLNDTLPDEVEFIAASGTYRILSGSIIVSWSLGDLEVDAFDSVWVKTVVKDSVTSGTVLACRAGIGCDQQVSAVAPTATVVRVPQLYLSKSAPSGTISAGSALTYTIKYSNTGDTTAFSAVLIDSLPGNVVYVSSTNGGSYNSTTNTVVWNLGNLPANMSAPLSVDLKVSVKTPLPNGTLITNKAILSSLGGFRRQTAATVTVQAQPSFTITKTTRPGALPGDTLVYQITVNNTGNSVATQTVVSDTLGQVLEFIEADHGGQYNALNRVVSWNLGEVAIDTPVQLTLTTRVVDSLQNSQDLINRIGVGCAEQVSATAEYTTRIRVPKLAVSKSASSEIITAGSELRYTIQYANLGDTTAVNSILVDSLSASVEFVSATQGGVYSSDGHVVTWDVGTLPAFMSSPDSVQLTVRIKSPLPNNTIISNKVTMGCAKAVGVGTQASVAVTVQAQPELNIVKSTRYTALPGDTLIYQLTCRNTGNGVATKTMVQDTLPFPLEFVSASANGQYNSSSRSVTWNLGDLTTDTPVSLTLTTKVPDAWTGTQTLINRATITAFEGVSSSDTAATQLTPLTIQVEADPDSIIGNGVDRTRLTALVQDASGKPAPDGMLVVFTATRGTFLNSRDTIAISNGRAVTTLVSDVINRASEKVTVIARAIYPAGGSISATTEVVFYTGQIVGIVTQPDKTPVGGAIITLATQSGVISQDTTQADGQYQLPVFSTSDYLLDLKTTDRFGQVNLIRQTVSVTIPDSGIFQPLFYQNAVSGRIIDAVSQLPVREANIPITLKSVSSSGNSHLGQRAAQSQSYTTVTDTSGFFYFTNLIPSRYKLEATYNGDHYYHDGTFDIDNTLRGQYIINADIALRQTPVLTWKSVDKVLAATGDTLTYRIYYESLANDVTDTFRIVDRLPDEVELLAGSVSHSAALQYEGYTPTTRELRFTRSNMPKLTVDSLQFAVRIGSNLAPGIQLVTNTATLISKQDTVSSAQDSRSRATTKVITPFLSIKKSVNKRVVEVGDILTYTITLENKSADVPLTNLTVNDILPPGFRYREGRSTWGGKKLTDPVSSSLGKQIQLVWTLSDTLQPGKVRELRYRIIAGLDSRYGENENQAWAAGNSSDGLTITSKIAKAEVILKPGLISSRGFIFGKVYIDENHDRIHNHGEPVLRGVEIITEEGIHVVTDSLGKYSIPNVTAGEHVLRVNQRTLPEGARIVLNSADFLGDSKSRLVKVSPGGIAKANFTIEPAPKPIIPPEPVKLREEPVEVLLTRSESRTDSAQLQVHKSAITQSFRLVVFKPWTLTMQFNFPSGEATLLEADRQALRTIGEFLKWQVQIRLDIHGHTNNLPLPPGAKYKDNEELSWARAEAVKTFLTKTMGIDPARITTKGFGETQPIADNSTPEGLRANRRVELIFKTDDTCERFEKTVRYLVRLHYTGEVPLSQVRYHEILPDGFTYVPEYTLLDDKSIEALRQNGEVVLDLGAWQDSLDKHLILAITPDNYRKMLTTSGSLGYLEWQNPDGSLGRTAELKNVIQTQVVEAYFRVMLEGALFDFGSYRLKPAALKALRKVGEFMRWQESMTMAVQGFTDSIGSVEGNLRLSNNRAKAVKDWLVQNYQINPERIRTEGFGKLFPVAENKTEIGRALNRRVEIIALSDFNQQVKVDVTILSDSTQAQLGRQYTVIDTLSRPDAPPLPSGRIHKLQMVLKLPAPTDAHLMRVKIDLPDGVLLAGEQLDSLRRSRTQVFTVMPGQTEFTTELLLESQPQQVGENPIRLSIETLDEKMVLKGTAKRELVVRLQ